MVKEVLPTSKLSRHDLIDILSISAAGQQYIPGSSCTRSPPNLSS